MNISNRFRESAGDQRSQIYNPTHLSNFRPQTTSLSSKFLGGMALPVEMNGVPPIAVESDRNRVSWFRGPFTYDVRTEEGEGLSLKHMIVLID